MPPCPPGRKKKFFHTIRGGLRIVKRLRSEYHSQLSQKFVQCRIAVSQPRKLDAVSIHIADNSLFERYDELSQRSQVAHFAPEELDQFVRIFDRARIRNHFGKVY